MICFQILSLYSITTPLTEAQLATALWFAFRFYLCIQSQLRDSPSMPQMGCDLLSDFIFVFNHNLLLIASISSTVVICFQILSLYSITTDELNAEAMYRLWFAFRFYLCIQSQPWRIPCDVSKSCDLLSDFIFVFNHNLKNIDCNRHKVVICFQILSLYSITTAEMEQWRNTSLWFAFRFYLCIQSQRFVTVLQAISCCDLLSDFIFVFNHNNIV